MVTVQTRPHPPATSRTPTRWRRLAPVVASGTAGLVGCLLLALADPSVPGRYGVCPFYATTGLWCPTCGSLRAVHHLTRGDVAAAAGANLLLVIAVPLAAYAWLAWASSRLGGPRLPVPRLPAHTWWALLAVGLVVLVAYGVLRNVEAFSWLAPDAVWAPGPR